MTDQTTRPTQSPCTQEEPPSPEWVQEMHDHFRQNGFYRAEDLQRVLGDPRDHVEVQNSSEMPTNFFATKRDDADPDCPRGIW